MIRDRLKIIGKILYTFFFTIGLIWCIIQLSWFEIRNYRIFYLPKLDSYLCVRLVESGYNNVDKYVDITLGDTIESVKDSNPWNSDIIRLSGKRWIQDYIGVRVGDIDTIYFEGSKKHQFILGKGDVFFADNVPIVTHMGGPSTVGYYSYLIETSSRLMIKKVRVTSNNENEEIIEVPLRMK